MKKIVLFAAIIGALTNMQAQTPERNIFLVHGLTKNGTGINAWDHYNHYFNNTRKANPIAMQYAQTTSLDHSANDLRSKMAAAVPTGTFGQNIAIAHSQGGPVLRALCRNTQTANIPFGGFVTVGSPNHGAQIINSYQQGRLTAFTQNATAQLLASPTANLVDIVGSWIPNYANSKLAKYVEDMIIAESAIDNVSAANLAVGGTFMTQLAQHVAAMPKVGIVTQEDRPNSHWKTLTSYVLKPVNNLGFEAVDDDDLEGYMAKGQDFYQGWVNFHNIYAGFGFLPRFIRDDHAERAEKWQRGVNWFTTSEFSYLDLIGGATTSPIYSTQSTCPSPCSYVQCAYGGNNCAFQSSTYISGYVQTTTDTDGIVNKSTQFLPGALINMELPSGINHAQQRNHSEITKAFDKILNGENVSGASLSYFTTDKL